jgi:hypothetical protein
MPGLTLGMITGPAIIAIITVAVAMFVAGWWAHEWHDRKEGR